jgi:folate-binding protein YgfZ
MQTEHVAVEKVSGEEEMTSSEREMLGRPVHIRIGLSSTVLEGRDTLNLVNRITTQKLDDMEEGEVRRTFICDGLGRAVDYLTVWNLADQVLLSGLTTSSNSLRDILQKAVSWKDEIEIIIGDTALVNIILTGRHIERTIIGIGLDSDDISETHYSQLSNTYTRRTKPIFDHSTFHLIAPTSMLEDIELKLQENGSTSLDKSLWNSIRVQSGILGAGEVDGTNIPFELDAAEDISLEKGCYPGQEIHARMESRGKLARIITKFSTQNNLSLGTHKINSGGRIKITSLTSSSNEIIETEYGLGLVKPNLLGTRIELADGSVLTPYVHSGQNNSSSD